MVTDDERREVAGYIRQIDCSGFTAHSMDDGDGRSLLCAYIAEAAGVGHAPYYFDAKPLCDRLADLIEPGPQCPYYSDERHWCSIHDIKTERTCSISADWSNGKLEHCVYRCSACGAVMLDDACYFDGSSDLDWFNYCPNCGAKVTEVGQWASRTCS